MLGIEDRLPQEQCVDACLGEVRAIANRGCAARDAGDEGELAMTSIEQRPPKPGVVGS